MIYGSIRAHTGPYGTILVARGEKSQVKKVKINISDRDFFQGLVQGDGLSGIVVDEFCCEQLFSKLLTKSKHNN